MIAALRPHLRTADEGSSPGGPERLWRARLDLELRLRAGRTRIGAVSHQGPLRIQRAFHPEPDGTAHVVVLHPPGGCVGGDHLHVRAALQPTARALLTTPGAGKVYRTNGHRAELHTTLDVAEGAHLEHVPQEMVVYEDADAALTTRVRLETGARFLGWEVVCLGRPAAGEGFARGSLRLDFTVEADGVPIFVERGHVVGGTALADAPWGLRGHAAFGTLVATLADAHTDVLAATRDGLREAANERRAEAAATCLASPRGPLLVVRALGRDGTRVRQVLEAVRHRVRDGWQRPRIDPGIWRS